MVIILWSQLIVSSFCLSLNKSVVICLSLCLFTSYLVICLLDVQPACLFLFVCQSVYVCHTPCLPISLTVSTCLCQSPIAIFIDLLCWFFWFSIWSQRTTNPWSWQGKMLSKNSDFWCREQEGPKMAQKLVMKILRNTKCFWCNVKY